MLKQTKQIMMLLSICAVISACSDSSETKAESSSGNDSNIVNLRGDDVGMNAAKAKGNATLPRFEELISAKTPGTYSFKTGLPYGENNFEHVWVQLDKIDGDTFHGKIANEPVNAKDYKLGQVISVDRAELSDWMIMSDTAIYGGYTLREILPTLPKEQAEGFRALLKD